MPAKNSNTRKTCVNAHEQDLDSSGLVMAQFSAVPSPGPGPGLLSVSPYWLGLLSFGFQDIMKTSVTVSSLQCVNKYWAFLFLPVHVAFRKVMQLQSRFDITLSRIKQPVACVNTAAYRVIVIKEVWNRLKGNFPKFENWNFQIGTVMPITSSAFKNKLIRKEQSGFRIRWGRLM